MDLGYVMSIYPDVHPNYLLMVMIDIRDNGWPQEYNIIFWFQYRLCTLILDRKQYCNLLKKLNAEKRSNLYKNIDFEGWKNKGRSECKK